jgi:hypothetical protein
VRGCRESKQAIAAGPVTGKIWECSATLDKEKIGEDAALRWIRKRLGKLWSSEPQSRLGKEYAAEEASIRATASEQRHHSITAAS